MYRWFGGHRQLKGLIPHSHPQALHSCATEALSIKKKGKKKKMPASLFPSAGEEDAFTSNGLLISIN